MNSRIPARMEKPRKNPSADVSPSTLRTKSRLRSLLRHDRRLAALLAVATFVTLAVLGAWLHPFEIPDYENDRYHLMADRLLAGEWPRDVYRPMLYVLLTAGLGAITGDCFVAGKLVSAFAGGLLVFATHRLARCAFGRRTALAAAALVAVSPLAIRYGLVASTDALSVALSTLCLAAALTASTHSGLRPAIAAGAAFSLAYWCRYQSIAALPIALLAVWIGALPQERLKRLGAFFGAAFVALLPHMTLTWLQFGKPLHDENWRNVALRHFSPNLDFGYLNNNPFHGLLSVLRHDPATIAKHAVEEAQGMANWGLRTLLVGNEGGPMLANVLLALAMIGAAVAWTHRPRTAGLLLLALCSYLGLVAVTFFGWDRMLLPVLPLMLTLVAFTLVVGMPRMVSAARTSTLRPRLVAGLPAAAGFALLWTTIPATETFAASQPTRAVEIARGLAARSGGDVGIVSNYGFLSRHCDGRHHFVWLGLDPAQTLSSALQPPGNWHWLILCRAETDAAGWKAVEKAVLPPPFHKVLEEPTVMAWRIDG